MNRLFFCARLLVTRYFFLNPLPLHFSAPFRTWLMARYILSLPFLSSLLDPLAGGILNEPLFSTFILPQPFALVGIDY